MARLGDNSAAFSAIKEKVFARYVSHTDAETIRANLRLQNIQFDVKAGPFSYFAELRELIETAQTVSGTGGVESCVVSGGSGCGATEVWVAP